MKITLVERRPVPVACLRYTGPLGEPVARYWRTTMGPLLAEHGLVDCPRYGVPLDNPEVTPAGHCRYDACVELPPGLVLPGTTDAIIAGGRYAITHFKGTAAQIGAAWGRFVGATLADPARRFDHERPAHEHYPRGASFDARTGIFGCELCLPMADL